MELTGLHLLLSYQCTLQCDHCFVFGSPWQEGTMSLDIVEKILIQGKKLGTVKMIYFEGGEPFLYYPTLLRGVEMAHEMGFNVGLVSNGFWGISEEDAFRALSPMRGKVSMLSMSCDQYHWDSRFEEYIGNIEKVAEELGINTGVITIAQPETDDAAKSSGTIPAGDSQVMFRGRAAVKLTKDVRMYPFDQFNTCPHEDFIDPGRVHVDPLGFMHICQGITIGSCNDPRGFIRKYQFAVIPHVVGDLNLVTMGIKDLNFKGPVVIGLLDSALTHKFQIQFNGIIVRSADKSITAVFG